MEIISIIPISEITKPAIAKPLGALNTPAKESISPKIHSIQSKIETLKKIKPINAKTKPLVPIPPFLDWLPVTLTVTLGVT